MVEHLTVDSCSNQMVPGSIPGGRIYTRYRNATNLQVHCYYDHSNDLAREEEKRMSLNDRVSTVRNMQHMRENVRPSRHQPGAQRK